MFSLLGQFYAEPMRVTYGFFRNFIFFDKFYSESVRLLIVFFISFLF